MSRNERRCGVLMHISSLPASYSIGSFGSEARHFVDLLCEGGFKLWQVLPFCMTDECNSPYKSPCSFGGNPYFIDLPTLYEKGLLTSAELKEAEQESPYLCEFDRLNRERLALLRKASERVLDRTPIIEAVKNIPALDGASSFLALREANGNAPWQEWTVESADLDTLFFWQFVQYEFFTQWMALKAYANERGISVIGDLPIYVAADSSDVWADKEQFLLDADGYPTSVAGVPPDYFSEDGQLWGNPLYNWKNMKKDGYSWWRRRLEFTLTLFDGVRLDHFRGLESYWSIPQGAKSAKEGKWVKGPGKSLINALREVAGDRLIIAEDLGDITEQVHALRRYAGFPGMRVMQFAFLGDRETPHLPHNYEKDCVVYSGTHDNNTLLGYVWELDEATRAELFAYCGCSGDDWNSACRSIIRTLLASHADTVILPIQDIMVFGKDTRMNTPGTNSSNWAYRLTAKQMMSIDAKKLRLINQLFGRA